MLRPYPVLCRRLCAFCLLLIFHGTGFSADVDIEEVASEYFATYAARKDFDKFMSFYDEQAVVKDVICDVEVSGIDAIRNFFDWNRGEFETVAAGPIMDLKRQIISDRTVISAGVFLAFDFDGEKLGPWEFIIWQGYSNTGKIILQKDWINYSPKKILIGPQADP
ncbi:MAG: hypothetical protein ACI82A_001553 [Candidatus Azotimanducaceae bacterium]|jgi:hypothetical protein